MGKVIDTAKELKDTLFSLKEVQEYLSLKSFIENDEELKRMRKEISRLEQENKLDEKANLLKIYNSNPLVNNFEIIKEEIKSLLKAISDIIA